MSDPRGLDSGCCAYMDSTQQYYMVVFSMEAS